MTREELIEIAEQVYGKCDWHGDALNHLEQLAQLVAEHEHERIKAANAPEIERVNAHIKKLEDEVLAEREACANVADGWPDYDVQGLAQAIRARGQE